MSILSAAFFENTLSTYDTQENLSTLSTVAQLGNNTYCTINSSSANDKENVTLNYMDSSYTRKSTVIQLNGVTDVATSGWNYAYVLSNTTSTWEARNLTNITHGANATNYSTILTKVPIGQAIHELEISGDNTGALNITLNGVNVGNISAGADTTTTYTVSLIEGNNSVNVTGNAVNLTHVQIKSYYFNTTDTLTFTNEGNAGSVWNLTSSDGGNCANSSGTAVYNCTCSNYTNVYRVAGTSLAYTTDGSVSSTSSTKNTDDGTTAQVYDYSGENIYLYNNTYFTTVWYYSTSALNITGGIVNSTNHVLPAGTDFLSTTAFTVTTSLPGTVTVTPNNNTRSYNLTSNDTLGTESYENDTAITDLTNSSSTALLLDVKPNMKLSTINATLTIVGEIDDDHDVKIYIASTLIGTLYANTSVFNVSQALLNASWTNSTQNTSLTFTTNMSDANITTATLEYRGYSNVGGWYVIPSSRLEQTKRVQVQPDYTMRCRNATLTSNSSTNNLTTTQYTRTGNTSGALTDLAYVYFANTTWNKTVGDISIGDAAGRVLYTIPAGNSTMTDNNASIMCLGSTGCIIKNLIYSADALWKMTVKVWKKDGSFQTLFASYQAAGYGGMLGTTIPKIGAGDRILFYGTPSAVDDTNTSIYYEVG